MIASQVAKAVTNVAASWGTSPQPQTNIFSQSQSYRFDAPSQPTLLELAMADRSLSDVSSYPFYDGFKAPSSLPALPTRDQVADWTANQIQSTADWFGSPAISGLGGATSYLVGAGIRTSPQSIVSAVGNDYLTYRSTGSTVYDSAVLAAGKRAPVAQSILAFEELYAQQSSNAHDLNTPLTGLNNVERLATIASDLAPIAAGRLAGINARAPNRVATPYGAAVQEQSAAALQVRSQIQQGATVYKGGVLGRSETGASQFLATESPLNPGYAGRYGLPPGNSNFDFILGGRVRPGAPVITRSAPGIPPNPGGGIEGVMNSGDFMIDWFHMP